MWGLGGKHYWARKLDRGGSSREGGGIVVLFAWMSSQDKHVKPYVDLYHNLGWNSLVCHSQFLNMFFPDYATSLAVEILNELLKELKIRPRPIVLAPFSGGPNACMFKVLQIVEGKCESNNNLDEYRLIRDCISGHIYDSCPVDFTSDLGTNFVLHPTVLGVSRPPMIISWIANSFATSLDALFLSRFESQRAEFWQTLYSSVSLGAPYLILCSEDDDLAPYQVICNFAQRIRDFGGDIKLVKWRSSSHVGHYRHHPEEYKAAVTELLRQAAVLYSRKNEQQSKVKDLSQGEISEPLRCLTEAVTNSNQSFKRMALESNDHFILPGTVEYNEGRDLGSLQDGRGEHFIPLSTPPELNAHGILGQILFDVCVPKNVEDWDLRSSSSLSSPTFARPRRPSHFNPIKCIRRSRL